MIIDATATLTATVAPASTMIAATAGTTFTNRLATRIKLGFFRNGYLRSWCRGEAFPARR